MIGISVLITVNNGHEWLNEAISSCQESGLTDIYVYDDQSSPPIDNPYVSIIRSEERNGPYVGRITLLNKLADNKFINDSHIIIFLDGDDKIINTETVYDKIRIAYSDANIQSVSFANSNHYNNATNVFKFIKNATYEVRKLNIWNLLPPHIRSFRLGMYRKLRLIDPTNELGKNENGKFITAGTDRALFNIIGFIAGYNAIKIIDADIHYYRFHDMNTFKRHNNITNQHKLTSLANELLSSYIKNF